MERIRAYQMPTLCPLTQAAPLPTPEASNTKAVAMRSAGRSPRDFLAPLWPTPTASLHNLAEAPETWEARRVLTKARVKNGNGFGTPLTMAVKMWPTPVARDCRTIKGAARAPNATGTEPLTVVVGLAEGTSTGALNPPWVEWLMGFPPGWTDLDSGAESPTSPA